MTPDPTGGRRRTPCCCLPQQQQQQKQGAASINIVGLKEKGGRDWKGMAHGRHMTAAKLASLSEGEEKERKKERKGKGEAPVRWNERNGKIAAFCLFWRLVMTGSCRERGCKGGEVRREGRVAVGGPPPTKSSC